jgi:drug/metabolite transporter (DMT)-like permease
MFQRVRAVGVPGIIVGAIWALMYVCFILALGYTSVANVLVLASISPFAAALLGGLFLRETVPGRTWAAMLAAAGGIVLMFIESINGGGLSGNLIALVIPLGFACNAVLLRSMHASVDMMPTLLLSGVFSMAVTLPPALPFEAAPLDFALLAIMGVVQLGLGCLLMLAAAPRLKAAELGLLAVAEIVFGTLSTWLVVGEEPGRLGLIGGLVVIAALAVNELMGLRGKPMSPSEETAVTTQAGH